MEVCVGAPGSGVTWSHAGNPSIGPVDAGALARSSEEHQWVFATQNPARCGRYHQAQWADTCWGKQWGGVVEHPQSRR
eukprot:12914007-Prorocentrum_lima.AAC.1